jgi:hypothetical protein
MYVGGNGEDMNEVTGIGDTGLLEMHRQAFDGEDFRRSGQAGDVGVFSDGVLHWETPNPKIIPSEVTFTSPSNACQYIIYRVESSGVGVIIFEGPTGTEWHYAKDINWIIQCLQQIKEMTK